MKNAMAFTNWLPGMFQTPVASPAEYIVAQGDCFEGNVASMIVFCIYL
jgi:hypothetical protein